ncbi:MAG: tRNA threonylcarbamoyladenosine biosynthesis protein TsaB, partial [Planctomycetota bacterium]
MPDVSNSGPVMLLDTSTRTGVIALGNPFQKTGYTRTIEPSQVHGKELVPAIGRLIHDSGYSIQDISALAVGIGPGSFTGLRVGLSVVKTMAEVLGIPVIPIDSLLLPVLLLEEKYRTAVSIADAQRGSVYCSVYERNPISGLW